MKNRTKAEAVKSRSEEQLVKDPLSLSRRGTQNKYYAKQGDLPYVLIAMEAASATLRLHIVKSHTG